jgi:5-methylcytosine-specific restriction endonuclease McrA
MENPAPPKLKRFPAAKQRLLDRLLERSGEHIERAADARTTGWPGRATDGRKRQTIGPFRQEPNFRDSVNRGARHGLGRASIRGAMTGGAGRGLPWAGCGARGGACEYCRLLEAATGVTFHIEHVRPRSRGGLTAMNNLALSCPGCNLAKAELTIGEDQSGRAQRLFNPRDFEPWVIGWHLHFALDRETGAILARTPVGEATILALRMNSARRMFARRLQVEAGLIA